MNNDKNLVKMLSSVSSEPLDPCLPSTVLNSYVRKDIMIVNHNLKDINPISCGQHMCEPGHFFGPITRSYFLIHYITSGKGTFYIEEESFELSKGEIFIIKPGEKCMYKADEVNPWNYRWVGFMASIDLTNLFNHSTIKIPECDYLFRQMVESDNIKNYKEYYITAKIFEILSLIAKKSEAEKSMPYEYVMSAKNYIEVNYYDPRLKVSDLADKLNIDRCYFSSIFKKYLNKSPQQYLTDYRLNKAAELISFNKLNLTEIAHSCGYTDIFNFSKMFKKKFNVPPSGYLKK